MKKLFKLLSFTFLASLLLMSCEIKKDFKFTVTKDVVINNYQSTTYSTTADINASDAGSDFEKFKSDLDAIELEGITYKLISKSSSAPSNQSAAALVKVSNQQGQNITNLARADQQLMVDIYQQELNANIYADGKSMITELLVKSPNSARVYFDAMTNMTPFTATFRFVFSFKATYKKSFFSSK